MKKLFLASSFPDVKDLFIDFVGDCRNKVVTFIPTASLVEKETFYVDNARDAFRSLGIVIDELDISSEFYDNIVNKLSKNDYIYLSGGNTFYLLQELKKSGADKLILNEIEKGKVYIGTSAGSIVTSPNIEFSKKMDDPSVAKELKNYDGLNLIDFNILPHQNNAYFKDIVDDIIDSYNLEVELCAINDSQVVIINGNSLEIASKN